MPLIFPRRPRAIFPAISAGKYCRRVLTRIFSTSKRSRINGGARPGNLADPSYSLDSLFSRVWPSLSGSICCLGWLVIRGKRELENLLVCVGNRIYECIINKYTHVLGSDKKKLVLKEEKLRGKKRSKESSLNSSDCFNESR